MKTEDQRSTIFVDSFEELKAAAKISDVDIYQSSDIYCSEPVHK